MDRGTDPAAEIARTSDVTRPGPARMPLGAAVTARPSRTLRSPAMSLRASPSAATARSVAPLRA
jgi:hypothetical protein